MVPFESPHEVVIGDVSDFETCRRAVAGQDAVIIAHMAPSSRPEVYATPTLPFDINVKGTALLLQSAVEQGIRRVVLISSISVLANQMQNGAFLTHDRHATPNSIYSLTKTLQEAIALYYHRQHGLEIAILRLFKKKIAYSQSQKNKEGILVWVPLVS